MSVDLTVIVEHRPGELARLGEVVGEAGISACGLVAFTGEGRGVVHVFLDDEAVASCRAALERAGIGVAGLGDGLDGSLVHLRHRDVTLLCFSRAPIERLTAYKRRMGWQFPYVSTYNTDFAFDFGLAVTEEQAEQASELKELIGNPPGWLQEWSGQIGAELQDGLRENPGWIAFARENGAVCHTYTVTAPDPFVAPYFSFLLERTPKAQPAEPRSWRKDEYPD